MADNQRLLPDWIAAYLKYTEDTEPPRSYHTWVAVSCIAGALQRRVHLQFGSERIYANMYVVLVGPPGARKGTALKKGEDIFRELGFPITGQQVIREQLIRRLAESTQNYDMRTQNKIGWQASLMTFSPELLVFFGQGDIKFLGLLTDWYDAADNWKYETKHQGTDEIKNVCYNLLGATAPEWIPSIFPIEAIGGGTSSRIIFVVEYNKGKTVPKERFLQEQKNMRAALVKDLQKIGSLTGEFSLGEEADHAYVTWYTLQSRQIAKGIYPIRDRRFSAYCERRQTHLRKLCMVMCASRSDKMVVSLDDFNRARSLLELTERNMPGVFGGLGRASTGQAAHMVLEYVVLKKTVRRSEILERFYQDIDFPTLESVQNTLEYMKAITVTVLPDEHDVLYTLIEKSTPQTLP